MSPPTAAAAAKALDKASQGLLARDFAAALGVDVFFRPAADDAIQEVVAVPWATKNLRAIPLLRNQEGAIVNAMPLPNGADPGSWIYAGMFLRDATPDWTMSTDHWEPA